MVKKKEIVYDEKYAGVAQLVERVIRNLWNEINDRRRKINYYHEMIMETTDFRQSPGNPLVAGLGAAPVTGFTTEGGVQEKSFFHL